MGLSNLSVRTRLGIAFGSLVLLVGVIAALSLAALSEANDEFAGYVEGLNARALLSERIRGAVDRRAIAARNLVLVTTPEDIKLEHEAVLKAHADVQSYFVRLHHMLDTGPNVSTKARQLVAEMDRIEQAYGTVALAIVDLAMQQRTQEAIAKMNTECRPLLDKLIKASMAYRDFTAGRAQSLVADAAARYRSQRALLIAVALASLAAAIVAAWLITRSLTRALGAEPQALGMVAQRIAQGDLSPIALDNGRSLPVGSVMASLVAMQGSLALIVGQVRKVSDSIATGSSEIASGNADLSQRTEEQASALQQTAATMHELGETVRTNAENARQASSLAESASAVAGKGGAVVGAVVNTMRGINEASRKIADITGVIDGIAFQTNILALNAAVEAARAGEQGRGFAVVATEVRSLAQRSAAAAKEIKALIGASVSQVDQGTALVDQAGRTMEEIVDSINRVSTIVAEISTASAEQSGGVGQVGNAVSQMDVVTQQNAALVEQSAAAADSLRIQAKHLVAAVGSFLLDKPPSGAGPEAHPPVRSGQAQLGMRRSSVRPLIGAA